KNEEQFQQMYREAVAADSKLKYVAQFVDGKAMVGLQKIPRGHDFHHLEGSDNIVLFYTQRYPDRPMIIEGAGAGADVTASGIFADIIRIGNYRCMEEIKVFCPATIANVSCGFDVLGLALESVGDEMVVRKSPEKGIRILKISGQDLPLEPERNVCGVAALALLEKSGHQGG